MIDENKLIKDIKECYTDEFLAEYGFDKLVEAQPKVNEWIPCSKRLPEKDTRYLVTRYDYVTNTEFIDILWYEKNIQWNGHQMGDYAVTAWMPLPKPYQEGEQEE